MTGRKKRNIIYIIDLATINWLIVKFHWYGILAAIILNGALALIAEVIARNTKR